MLSFCHQVHQEIATNAYFIKPNISSLCTAILSSFPLLPTHMSTYTNHSFISSSTLTNSFHVSLRYPLLLGIIQHNIPSFPIIFQSIKCLEILTSTDSNSSFHRLFLHLFPGRQANLVFFKGKVKVKVILIFVTTLSVDVTQRECANDAN